jgi:predicted nucleic acid-binding protein
MSVFAPDRPPVPSRLQLWIVEQGRKGALFTSAIVVLEIRKGISNLRRRGGVSRADRMQAWLDEMFVDFKDRMLPVDENAALVAGDMEDTAKASGRNPGLADILIAATARIHDLTVLTSNARHFEMLGVPNFNPLSAPLPE